MTWHRPARIAVGIIACASAVAAYVTSSKRPEAAPAPPLERLDPKAILESRDAVLQRVREAQETFEVRAARTLHYDDESTRQFDVHVNVRRRGGRDFAVTAKEATSTQGNAELELSGAVKLRASDGFELAVERATYSQDASIVSADGDVAFLKGHLSGSSTGMTYDTSTEVLSLLADPDVRLSPDVDAGTEGMAFRSRTAKLDRVQHLLALEGEASVARGAQVLSGDSVLARLSEDEQRVTFVELRGHARVTGSEKTFQEMQARDMDLAYAEDGTTIERAVLRGDAAVVLAAAGEAGGHRRFAAGLLDLSFDAEGAVTRVVGSEGTHVEIPGSEPGRLQTVTGTDLLAEAGPDGTLSDLRFTGDVVYQEKGGGTGTGKPRKAGGSRTATARTLQLRVTDDGVHSAAFGGGATFEESGLSGAASTIEYDVRAGRLVLASTVGEGDARLVDERLSMTARRMDVGLEARDIQAAGGVKTELRPAAPGDQARRMPGLFAQERAVYANAERVASAASGERMVYSGDAALWQGDTAVRAASIELDRERGNLTASGAARLSLPLDDGLATGRATRFQYDDAKRRVTLDTPVAAPVGGASATAATGRATSAAPAPAAAVPAASAPAATPAPAAARGAARGTSAAPQGRGGATAASTRGTSSPPATSNTPGTSSLPSPPSTPAAASAPAATTASAATGAAVQSYLSGPQGEVRADRITVDLAARTAATERMEANGTVTLRVGAKRAASETLRYLAKDGSYELVGTARAPVSVVESCRATTGKTLIFYGSTDRILVDGNEEIRTQTKGGGACTPSAR